MAEQQRAKSEIEAALTIAAARPRDEKESLDRILVSCQRPGVAEEAEYEYSRGGTAITGPTIKLLELVAQHWGNIEFGFRELARYPGIAGQPGESVVEAFAWDLQTNTRRKVGFTVQHAMKSGTRMKPLSDPRDIYEYVANQAQRRVRTCLENIIPRDIVDTAAEECRRTLSTSEAITPEKIAKTLQAFAGFGVNKDMIEARLQRRIDTITPAQMVQLRRIYTSLRDGIGKPEDWFAVPEPATPQTAMEAAKSAMRKAAPPAAAPTPAPEPKEPAAPAPETVVEPEAAAESNIADAALESDTREGEYMEVIATTTMLGDLGALAQEIQARTDLSDTAKARLARAATDREAAIRAKRGVRSNARATG